MDSFDSLKVFEASSYPELVISLITYTFSVIHFLFRWKLIYVNKKNNSWNKYWKCIAVFQHIDNFLCILSKTIWAVHKYFWTLRYFFVRRMLHWTYSKIYQDVNCLSLTINPILGLPNLERILFKLPLIIFYKVSSLQLALCFKRNIIFSILKKYR